MQMKHHFKGEGEGEKTERGGNKMEDASISSSPPRPTSSEKIFVTVRVRPLSKFDRGGDEEEEGEQNENNERSSDWECINEKTIIFKTTIPERSMYPTAYSFDRVFGSEVSTDEVYEEGAKEVALSALSGLNATIFAYGQTGSGKTYTMNGVTYRALTDIYNYIEKHPERVFVLKLSAMEIYNEVVRDLLSSDSSPLRLLEDPERGTVIEKLVEERVQDKGHFQKLLNMCEANRQVAETMLNETSSRSHQIIRLTIESCVRDELPQTDLGSSSCIVASLNFVDLAGSERASQALSAGTRLKEGCHINRSLLTLGTVIRKLSGSTKMRNGHIPYRDSKLTRILQHALGGNARTAIICTMSPARRHVEQSRNTLFFASCAKEVATSAHVNVVMSDKALVKHLQKEVARLENELQVSVRPPSSRSTESLLREKDLKIQKMEQEIKELTRQRNYAQRQLEDLRHRIESNQTSNRRDSLNRHHTPGERIESDGEYKCPASELSGSGHEAVSNEVHSPIKQDCCGEESNQATSGNYLSQGLEKVEQEAFVGLEEFRQSFASMPKKQPVKESALSPVKLVHEIRKLEYLQEELGKDANRALETLQKEVQFLHLAQSGTNKNAASTLTEIRGEIQALQSKEEKLRPPELIALRSIDMSTTLKEEISRLDMSEDFSGLTDTDATIAALEQQLQIVEKSIESLPIPAEALVSPLSRTPSFINESRRLTRSVSCQSEIISSYLSIDTFEHNENSPLCASEKALSNISGNLSRKLQGTSSFADIKKVHNIFKTAAQENISSIRSYVTELKERVAKLQYQKQLLLCQVMELEKNGNDQHDENIKHITLNESSRPVQSPSSWALEFDKQRMQIIELWATCCVSIIHRSHFFLLFKGDPGDAMYMEVELRRLSFLKEKFCQRTLKKSNLENDQITFAFNVQALRHEREMLAKQMQRKLTPEEREILFKKWGIALNAKQRKLQLTQKLWADTQDMDHIQNSANLVAKLVGFWKSGAVSKEMFELNFTPPKNNQRPSSWNPFSILLSV